MSAHFSAGDDSDMDDAPPAYEGIDIAEPVSAVPPLSPGRNSSAGSSRFAQFLIRHNRPGQPGSGPSGNSNNNSDGSPGWGSRGSNQGSGAAGSGFSRSIPDVAITAALCSSRFGGNLDDPTYKEMIVVMGMRGSGKSSFCNLMAGGEIMKVGNGQAPCTRTCQPIPIRVGRTKCIFVDTPGIDPANPDEILFELSNLLSEYYQRGISLRGIIILHRISENRITRVSTQFPQEILRIVRHILGVTKLQNVTLGTTFWKGHPEVIGAVNERELREGWAPLLESGATLGRFYGDRPSGVGMAGQILGNLEVPIESDQELIEKGQQLQKRIALERQMAMISQQLAQLN